jgi:YidC/Oxa1 family membrane protein insertase
MLPMLEYFRHALGNYGWAIILVTIVIKVALLPLSIKQTQSSRKMQSQMGKIKPELDRIQEKFNQRKKKHENNPEKLEEIQKEFQEQMMVLYRENGVMNPLGGCLPTLLQLPLLIALYWTFSGPPFQPALLHLPLQASAEVSTKSSLKTLSSPTVNFVAHDGQLSRLKLESDIPNKLLVGKDYKLNLKQVFGKGELPSQTINWNILAKGQNPHQAEHKPDSSAWAKDVINLNVLENGQSAQIKALKPTEKFAIQVEIPEKRGHQTFLFIKDLGRLGFMDHETKEIHWDIVVLILFMGLSFWFSNKTMMTGNPQPPSLDDSQQEMQKQMQNLMPIMFLGMMAFFPIPAGVFIYFIVSNVFQILQTVLIPKFFPINEKA